MKVYIVNVNNCEAYSDYHEGNWGIYLTHQDAFDAMTELGFDPSTKTRVIPWYGFEDEKDWFESGWYNREEYRIEEWELPERTCKRLRPYYGDAPVIGAPCICSECRQELAADHRYCPNCGAKVVEK